MKKDKPVEQKRRTRSKSPARGQAKSKSPPRSRSKSPSRTPLKTSSKAEKVTSKSDTAVSSETKVRSSRKSETSTVTKNATPKKSVEQYEYVKTKSSKKLETELPSRQSSRIAVKLTQMTPSLTERKVSVKKTTVDHEDVSGKSKKLRKATQLGNVIFVTIFALFYVALLMASVLFCNLLTCNLNQLPTIPRSLAAFIDLEALMIVTGWIVLQALLACVPVGSITTGPLLADGRKLQYRCNGFFAFIVSAAILAAMYYLKLGVFEMLSKHFIQMTVVSMLVGILFGIISHVASRRLPPKLVSHRANTGLAFGDALIGRYLNPRIWKLDVKMFFIFNIALLGHLAVCAVTFIEAYQREKLNTAMIIMGLYSTILFLQYIVFQTSLVNSMYTMHEGFGILMSLIMMALPFFDSVLHRYLFNHPHNLCYPEMAASVILFVAGFYILIRSEYVKAKFRQNPHDPYFAEYDMIPTISGKSLLASGLWGWCRHPNYFGWILVTVAGSLLCGVTCPLAYLYIIWELHIFSVRAYDDGRECERKHGSTSWTRYCQRVRSRLIPYIY